MCVRELNLNSFPSIGATRAKKFGGARAENSYVKSINFCLANGIRIMNKTFCVGKLKILYNKLVITLTCFWGRVADVGFLQLFQQVHERHRVRIDETENHAVAHEAGQHHDTRPYGEFGSLVFAIVHLSLTSITVRERRAAGRYPRDRWINNNKYSP